MKGANCGTAFVSLHFGHVGLDLSRSDREAAIDRYLAVYNEAPKPFVWAKTACEILASGT